MPIDESALRGGIRAWLAEHQDRELAHLTKALAVVYRDRPPSRTIEEVVENLLLVVAQMHGRRITAAMERLESALNQLLADVRAVGEGVITTAMLDRRRINLKAVAAAVDNIKAFEEDARQILAEDKGSLAAMARDVIAGNVPDPVGELAPLRRITSRGNSIMKEGEEVLAAWQAGQTVEPQGSRRYPLKDRLDPALVRRMNRMRAAMDRFESLRLTDQEQALRAVEELRQEVEEGTSALRGEGRSAKETRGHEPVPPTRPLPDDVRPAPKSPETAALRVRRRVADLDTRVLAGEPLPTRDQLVKALAFATFDVTVEGVVREGVPRGGTERALRSAAEIRKLPTRPPWLAGHLADLFAESERAHLSGAGVGGETPAGLGHAPRGVNQDVQNRGIETTLRKAGEFASDVDYLTKGKLLRLAIPLEDGSFDHVDILRRAIYDVPADVSGGSLRLTVDVNPDGSWRVVDTNLPPGIPGGNVPRSGTR